MTLENIDVYSSGSLYFNIISKFKNNNAKNVLIRNPVTAGTESFRLASL